MRIIKLSSRVTITIFLSVTFLFLASVLSSTPAKASTDPITPTLYCLGSCPNSAVNKTISEAPQKTVSITPQTTIQAPAKGRPADTSNPADEPCATGESSIQHDKQHKKSSDGSLSKFFELLFRLIELLLKALGVPIPDNPGTNPTPTTSPSVEPSPSEGIIPSPSDEPSPTVSPCPQPSDASPAPTTTVPPSANPSTEVPSTTPPTSTGSRDPLKQPFASTSIWNMPIGSNAVFVAANLPSIPRGDNYAPMPQIDDEHIVLKPTAPLVTIAYSDAAWSGKNRCGATGGSKDGLPVSVPIPNDYIVPHDNTNSAAVFLLADGRTLIQTQPFTRCSAGGPGTSVVKVPNADLYGDGIVGVHGGSNLSAIGGSIRVGELRPGQQGMKHAIKINVDSPLVLYPCKTQNECFRWPALKADSGAAGDYGSKNPNPNPALKMGSLLAIPKSTNIASLGLESEPGKQMAWTLQNYGAYIVDSTGGAGFAISAENGPDGNMRTQFRSDWGYDLEQRVNSNTVWSRDMQKLVKALSVVNNNSPTSIGGGGTPLQPLAPAIAPK